MKSLKKTELAVISLTVLCIAFSAGFFVGRSTSGSVITIERLAEDEGLVSDPLKPDTTPDEPCCGETYSDGISVFPGSDTQSEEYKQGGEKVNINKATPAELALLPGIGDALADRIIEYRNKNGGFLSVEEILNVSGIGEKKYSSLKDMITVG